MGSRLETDFLIVGAGIAGLRAAIELAGVGRVLVVTKEQLGESNTHYAQGGIAVALGGEEDVELHLDDTMRAGDGLVNEAAAAILVEEGPLRVEELLEWGTHFDRDHGKLMLTREGAHSRSRILHANGDATGAEIGRSLLEHARSIPNIKLAEWLTCEDLIVDGGTVVGLVVATRDGQRQSVSARAVLLASGGAGQVYSDTTNPAVATGDGIAMAWRAGAEIADMEFYQFHPTALSLPGVARFLLSEALRGEGAWLRNSSMERFMERYHPLLELAPRDVVARAITREGMGARPGDTLPVYLDMRHVTGLNLNERFPGITAFLREQGLDLGRDLIPVRPAAHYLMGGVRTDIYGRTSLKRLYAAGEVACTGVHGANRLASNSLLEGLVFGARAASEMRQETSLSTKVAMFPQVPQVEEQPGHASANFNQSPSSSSSAVDPAAAIQHTMWVNAGLLRDRQGLESAAEDLRQIANLLPTKDERSAIELRSLHAVGTLIVRSALAREESRGAHYRNDFPQRIDEKFQKHSVVTGDSAVRFVKE